MTTKIRLNNKNELKRLRAYIDAALASAEQELGLKIKTGSCSYDADGDSCRFKLEVETLDAEPVEVKEWKAGCQYLDTGNFKHRFCALDIGAEISLEGQLCTIAGAIPRGRKWNVAIRKPDGSMTRMQSKLVYRLMCLGKGERVSDFSARMTEGVHRVAQ